jgi:hypothetical protein
MAKHRYKTHLQSVSFVLASLDSLGVPQHLRDLLIHVTNLQRKYPLFSVCQCRHLVDLLSETSPNVSVSSHSDVLWISNYEIKKHLINTSCPLLWRMCLSLFSNNCIPRKRKNTDIAFFGHWTIGMCGPADTLQDFALSMSPDKLGAKQLILYLNNDNNPVIHISRHPTSEAIKDVSIDVGCVLVCNMSHAEQINSSNKRVQQLTDSVFEPSGRPIKVPYLPANLAVPPVHSKPPADTDRVSLALYANVYIGIHTLYSHWLDKTTQYSLGSIEDIKTNMQLGADLPSLAALREWEQTASAQIKAKELEVIKTQSLESGSQAVCRLVSLKQLGARLSECGNDTECPFVPKVEIVSDSESQRRVLEENLEYLSHCMQWVRSKNGLMAKWRVSVYNSSAKRMITGKSAMPCYQLQSMLQQSLCTATRTLVKFPYCKAVHLVHKCNKSI